MKKRNMLISAIIVITLSCLGCAPGNPSTNPTAIPDPQPLKYVVQNPDFENFDTLGQPLGWSPLPEKWSIDPNVAHSGKHSLRVQNYDPTWYRYPYQEIFVVPGKSYQISLWIKGEELNGTAGFYLEYFGLNGSWLGGDYDIPMLQRNSGWQSLILKEIIIPDRWLGRQVAHINFPLLLSEGTTGTVWFDDISIEEIKPPLMEVFLVKPNYRGILVSNMPKQINALVRVNSAETGLMLNNLNLGLYLENPKGIIIQEKILPLTNNPVLELNLDISGDLPLGKYILRIQLTDTQNGTCLTETAESLEHISPEVQNHFSACIDQANRLLCQGTPFFPLGIYTANAELPLPEQEDEIKEIAKSPFDTLLNYNTLAFLDYGCDFKECYNIYIQPYLNLLQQHNLRTFCAFPTRSFFNLPDSEATAKIREIVSTLKNHPAILGWYLNDEIGPSYITQLNEYYHAVRAEDPNHPIWSVIYRLQNLKRMASTTDIIGVNPYPIPHTPLVYVAEAAEAAREAGRQARPFWIVIQAHGPSRQQVRCMTYLGLISRASGLFYYSYFDLWKLNDADARWEWLKKIGEEVKILRPVLLSSETIPVSEITCDQPAVYFLVKRYQDYFYLLLTNSSETERVQAKFQGSDRVSFTEPFIDYLLEKNLGPEISNNSFFIANNQLTVTLAPLEVQVYKWPVFQD